MKSGIDYKVERLSEDEMPDHISIPTWAGSGMLVNRWALDSDHPEHPYWYVWREYGIDPKRYGIGNPMKDAKRVNCPCCGHSFIYDI